MAVGGSNVVSHVPVDWQIDTGSVISMIVIHQTSGPMPQSIPADNLLCTARIMPPLWWEKTLFDVTWYNVNTLSIMNEIQCLWGWIEYDLAGGGGDLNCV